MDRYEYTVTGGLSFPVDMLRYDRAWPAQERDAGEIHAALDRHRGAERRTVHLHGLDAPTKARWASFGWRVLAPRRIVNVGTVRERTIGPTRTSDPEDDPHLSSFVDLIERE